MVVCDRCKKPARLFAYGDGINESYDYLDLCFDCSLRLKSLILRFKHGEDVVVINHPKEDFHED